MHFYYGAGEKPVFVNFNGTMYTYVYSLQGDVVALLDAGGNVVVEYQYDAWGNIVASTGSLVSTLGYLNPFRYRGYVYDEETGRYYCQNRYYSSKFLRWINTDYMNPTCSEITGNNVFTYCLNNPIYLVDLDGMDAIILYDHDGVGHIGALIQDSNGQWWHFYWGTQDFVSAIFGKDVPSHTWCVKYSGLLSLASINSDINYEGCYEELYYLEGDFSRSLEYLMNIDEFYNLYSNNCSIKTMQLLSVSDTRFKDALNTASSYFIPSVAFGKLKAEIINNNIMTENENMYCEPTIRKEIDRFRSDR